jgi:putative FmdB family regulatory protein
MPFYDFRCAQCGSIFEIRASFKEKEAGLEPECPECHSHETRQEISSALVLRGSDGGAFSMPACGPSAGPGCC